jgi:alpha-glucosidase
MQRYPVHWSGDGVARFEDLACVLRAALSIGLSGVPFYSSDVGGFSGNPDAELWVRWMQLGALMSHVRAHGSPPREPWEYGPLAEDLSRQVLELRYRLLPYLWTQSRALMGTGQPLVRPLLLDSPGDRVAWDVDDQYLLGTDLLVAPVLEAGARRRRVYLPDGDWYVFATGERLAGGRFVVAEAPLDTVPMYVRAGAAVPMGPVQQHVDELPCDPLTVHVYGTGAGSADVVAGDVVVPIRWSADGDSAELTTGPAPGVVELVWHAPSGDTTTARGDARTGVTVSTSGRQIGADG